MALASAGARADGSTSGFLVAYRMLALVFHGVQQRAVRRVKFVVNALVPRGDPRSDRDVTAARSASPRAVRSPRLAPTRTPSRPCQDLRDVAAHADARL